MSELSENEEEGADAVVADVRCCFVIRYSFFFFFLSQRQSDIPEVKS